METVTTSYHNIGETEPYEDPLQGTTNHVLMMISDHMLDETMDEDLQYETRENKKTAIQNLRIAIQLARTMQKQGNARPYFIGLLENLKNNRYTYDLLFDNIHDYVSEEIPQIEPHLPKEDIEARQVFHNFLLERDHPKAYSYFLENFSEFVITREKKTMADYIYRMADAQMERDDNFTPKITKSFTRLLTKGRFDPLVQKEIETWTKSAYPMPEDFPDTSHSLCEEGLNGLKGDINLLMELEREHPGISEFLMNEWNIYSFSRYPKQVLIDQYEKRNDLSDSPHGLLISATSDWNESMRRADKATLYDKFYTELQRHGIDFRIGEVGSVFDMEEIVKKVSSLYGKTEFVVIEGHGHVYLMNLGGNTADSFTIEDLQNPRFNVIKNSIKKDATIVLPGCDMGAPQGFAQQLSEKGFTVIAANSKSTLINLTYSQDTFPQINATYRDDGHLVIYRNGTLIKGKTSLLTSEE